MTWSSQIVCFYGQLPCTVVGLPFLLVYIFAMSSKQYFLKKSNWQFCKKVQPSATVSVAAVLLLLSTCAEKGILNLFVFCCWATACWTLNWQNKLPWPKSFIQVSGGFSGSPFGHTGLDSTYSKVGPFVFFFFLG